MTTPHKHAELIKAWADGAEIECKREGIWGTHNWGDIWHHDFEYRIKPGPVAQYCQARFRHGEYCVGSLTANPFPGDNLKLTFDGETGKLLRAEVIESDVTL